MATAATGISAIIAGLAEQVYGFLCGEGVGGTTIGTQNITSTWSLASSGSNKIVWDGANPTIQNQSAGVLHGRFLGVTRSSNNIAIIPHASVELQPNDTIVYTSIEIEFESVDLPIVP